MKPPLYSKISKGISLQGEESQNSLNTMYKTILPFSNTPALFSPGLLHMLCSGVLLPPFSARLILF
jgi:hypothetical protein